MKKIILLMLPVIFISIAGNTQISKGQKMIGGEITFRSSKDESGGNFVGPMKTKVFIITPQVGFRLGKNWIAGVSLGYAYQNQKYAMGNSYSKTDMNLFSAGLFARKFHPFTDVVGIFGQLDVATGIGKSKETNVQNGTVVGTSKADALTVSAIVKPGLYFKATKKIIVEANLGGLGYTHLTNKPDSGPKSKLGEFSFTLTSTIGLGVQIVF